MHVSSRSIDARLQRSGTIAFSNKTKNEKKGGTDISVKVSERGKIVETKVAKMKLLPAVFRRRLSGRAIFVGRKFRMSV